MALRIAIQHKKQMDIMFCKNENFSVWQIEIGSPFAPEKKSTTTIPMRLTINEPLVGLIL